MADGRAQRDGRMERGDAKRAAILTVAVDLASQEGLTGVSIGRLATELEISKSGVMLHFGSKTELQLATVSAAADRFVAHVITPARAHPAGLARLRALMDRWLEHVERRVFPGGCFFTTVAMEFKSRPGRVRDAVAEAHRRWLDLLEQQVEVAVRQREVRADVSPRQLAFTLDAFLRQAALWQQLHDDTRALDNSMKSIVATLDEAAG